MGSYFGLVPLITTLTSTWNHPRFHIIFEEILTDIKGKPKVQKKYQSMLKWSRCPLLSCTLVAAMNVANSHHLATTCSFAWNDLPEPGKSALCLCQPTTRQCEEWPSFTLVYHERSNIAYPPIVQVPVRRSRRDLKKSQFLQAPMK